MANLKSSKKDILTNKRNRTRNQHFKSKMKSVVRAAREAIEQKSAEKADQVKVALKSIDKTAAKGVIHKNTAARKKSRLAKALNKAQVTA